MQASEFIYENIGTKYEADINKSLYANDVGSGKGAGSGHGADAVMIINKKQYPVEIKAKNARDFGQGTLDYNGKKWVAFAKDKDMQDQLNTLGAAKFANKVWKGITPKKAGKDPKELSYIDTHTDLENFEKACQNRQCYQPLDFAQIAKYYNNKGIHYIHLGGRGLFQLGDKDPAKLKADKFIPTKPVQLRIRLKGGGRPPGFDLYKGIDLPGGSTILTGNYRFTTAFVSDPSSWPKASTKYSLDPADVDQFKNFLQKAKS
jgi:hypothetical protein